MTDNAAMALIAKEALDALDKCLVAFEALGYEKVDVFYGSKGGRISVRKDIEYHEFYRN